MDSPSLLTETISFYFFYTIEPFNQFFFYSNYILQIYISILFITRKVSIILKKMYFMSIYGIFVASFTIYTLFMSIWIQN